MRTGSPPVVFKLTGLESATTCQKSNTLMFSVVEDWNRSHWTSVEPITIELSVNHYSRSLKSPAIRRVLLLLEPSVTWPLNKLGNFRFYDFVYASNSDLAGAKEVSWFNAPSDEGPFEPSQSDRADKFTVVAADKLSLIKGELYSLRRRAVCELSEQIEVFGSGWEANLARRVKKLFGELLISLSSGKPVSTDGIRPFLFWKVRSRGMVEHKHEAYSRNSYALVIENSLELRTEKLYDAIESGAIPVYVGPECSDGIPKELFVHAGPSIDEIKSAMTLARAIDKSDWHKTRKKWTESEDFKRSDVARMKAFLDQAALDVVRAL